MSYRLKFVPKALKEWERLDGSIKEQFKKVLARRLDNPHIPASRLFHLDNCYKIKLKNAAYRLVYQVIEDDNSLFVLVIAKRDDVYKILHERVED